MKTKDKNKLKTMCSPKKNWQYKKQISNYLKSMKKKLCKKWIAVVAIVLILLHFFPVYRLITASTPDYYTRDELVKLLYIGSYQDRAAVRPIIKKARAAFRDCEYKTDAENEEKYGLLARYVPYSSESAFVIYHLRLWSAHLDENEGYIWVHYSREVFDKKGNTIQGAWDVPSLWKVQKNDQGEWVVVEINEGP